MFRFGIVLLLFAIGYTTVIAIQQVEQRAPQRPQHFLNRNDVEDFLIKVRAYMNAIGRPRYGG